MPLDDLINKYVPMTETAFLILSSLQEPKHGYLIMAYTKKVTHNRIVLANGTLYGTLSRMERDKLVTVQEDNQRKIYHLTELGNTILKIECRRIQELSHLIEEGR
ncbi:PadR family transcriptional regulator [Vagococcus allomyrinae]|uniref:PadR family transcriptional regulator n=1 Tax=Vagococcus allomyrinae TaxID=2794353 RepID=UPI0032214E2D